MAVTLRQIADHTGLSTQTISQCLRPDSPKAHLYPAKTRERVVQAARELGYRPNAAARAVARRRFGIAALVMSLDPVRSSLFPGLLCGLHDALAQRDMQMTIARLPDSQLADESCLPTILRQWCCDGLLINYTDAIPDAMIQIIADYKLPAVWINSRQNADCVRADDFDGARRLTEHLLGLGHRRIAFADFAHGPQYPCPHYSVQDRQDGYRQAMQAACLPHRLLIADEGERVPASQRVAWCAAALREPDRPTAIIGYGPNDATVAYCAALSVGLAVGHDVALAMFGDRPLHYLGEPLTTMIVPEETLGRLAVEMLLEKIDRPEQSLQAKLVPMELSHGDA